MGRKSLVAVLLLPLPFAALPVASVLFGHYQASTTEQLNISPAGYESQIDAPSHPPEQWSVHVTLQKHLESAALDSQRRQTSSGSGARLC